MGWAAAKSHSVWCSFVSQPWAELPAQVSGPPLSHKEGMLRVDRALLSLERNS